MFIIYQYTNDFYTKKSILKHISIGIFTTISLFNLKKKLYKRKILCMI